MTDTKTDYKQMRSEQRDWVYGTERDQHINLLCQLFTRLDRTLSGNAQVTVRDPAMIAGQYPAPAWTNMNDSEINIAFRHRTTGHLQFQSDEEFVHLLGVNYHEVAHVLYTPVINLLSMPKLNKFIDENRALHALAWNILEDGRIERLISGEYINIRRYLNIMFANVFGRYDLERTAFELWLFTAPRAGELPRAVVDTIRKAAEDEARANSHKLLAIVEAEKIASTYNKLVLPRDEDQVVELVRQYSNLIRKTARQGSDPSGDVEHYKRVAQRGHHRHGTPENEGTASPHRHGAGDPARQQSAQEKRAEREKEEAQSGTEYDGSERGKRKPEDGAQGKAGGSKPGSGQSDGKSKSPSAQNGSQGRPGLGKEKSDRKLPPGTGAGFGGPRELTLDDVNKRFGAMKKRIMNSQTMKSEIKGHRDSMRLGKSFINVRKRTEPKIMQTVTPADRIVARKVGRDLQKLVATLDPGWDRMRSSGKLNVQRFSRVRDLETGFDNWIDDKSDASHVEMLLLLDASSSMAGRNEQEAAEAAWILRSAVQQIGGSVTGYGFNSYVHYLWSREEKVTPNKYPRWGAAGGTALTPVVTETIGIFRRSRAKTKLLVVLTDGEFNERRVSHISNEADTRWSQLHIAMDDFRKIGVHRSRFFIGGRGNEDDFTKMFDLNVTVTDPLEMVEPVSMLVKELIKRKAH